MYGNYERNGMSGSTLMETNVRLGSTRTKRSRSKVLYIYGQRKAHLTIKVFIVVENGEHKIKYYRKLSFS